MIKRQALVQLVASSILVKSAENAVSMSTGWLIKEHETCPKY